MTSHPQAHASNAVVWLALAFLDSMGFHDCRYKCCSVTEQSLEHFLCVHSRWEACNAANRGNGTHHNPRRCFPGNQREECRQYDCEVEWLVDATSPYGLIQNRQQDSYDALFDSCEKRAGLRV